MMNLNFSLLETSCFYKRILLKVNIHLSLLLFVFLSHISWGWAWEGDIIGTVYHGAEDEPEENMSGKGEWQTDHIEILAQIVLKNEQTGYLYVRVPIQSINQRIQFPSSDHNIGYQVVDRYNNRLFYDFTVDRGWLEMNQTDETVVQMSFDLQFDHNNKTRILSSSDAYWNDANELLSSFDDMANEGVYQLFFNHYQAVDYLPSNQTMNQDRSVSTDEYYDDQYRDEDEGCNAFWGDWLDDEDEEDEEDEDYSEGGNFYLEDQEDTSSINTTTRESSTSDEGCDSRDDEYDDESGCDESDEWDDEDDEDESDDSGCDDEDDSEGEAEAHIKHTHSPKKPVGYKLFIKVMRHSPLLLTWFVIWFWKRRSYQLYIKSIHKHS